MSPSLLNPLGNHGCVGACQVEFKDNFRLIRIPGKGQNILFFPPQGEGQESKAPMYILVWIVPEVGQGFKCVQRSGRYSRKPSGE